MSVSLSPPSFLPFLLLFLLLQAEAKPGNGFAYCMSVIEKERAAETGSRCAVSPFHRLVPSANKAYSFAEGFLGASLRGNGK